MFCQRHCLSEGHQHVNKPSMSSIFIIHLDINSVESLHFVGLVFAKGVEGKHSSSSELFKILLESLTI